MSDISVRRTQRTDVRAGSQVLARAFYDDPVMRWMFPDADRRRRKLPRLFDAVIRHHHLANGACEVANELLGMNASGEAPTTSSAGTMSIAPLRAR